ncbi:hypothetical protein M3223_10455 [Paenibacillus pasadenensis]|uniref:hypothetical protein n=1 Tax=Paenibacillus pasadenensis TaxID=217090 RepID=UPI00203C3909|nr:hypothetical protein [Paenibacillus pasadenensis]MCM3747778.1 hypothetical protein [Paenibacillus pasadenensis]
MKSLKTKIAVGVLATGIVASMGTAFAGVDIAGQFNSWYQAKFNQATGKVVADTTKDYASKLNSYNNEYNTLKNGTVNEVVVSQQEESKNSMLKLNQQKNEYISQVNAAADGLQANTAPKFEQFVNDVNGVVNGVKDQAKAYGENDLKKSVDSQTQKSVTQTGKDVAAYQKSAVDNLTAKIQERQAQLDQLIKDKAATSDSEIRAHIEAKIAELRAELTAYAKQQADLAKAAVKAEADTKTAAALKALEAAATIK